MNKDLCIKVYPAGGFDYKPLLERHKTIDTNVTVPYEKIIDTLQYLFGDKCIITFNYY